MSGADFDHDRADQLTEQYRAASAADPARPGDSVRESIFAHARTIAASRAPRGVIGARFRRPAANDSSWRVAAAASVVVAGFATLLAWHARTPTSPAVQASRAPPSNPVTRSNPVARDLPGPALADARSTPRTAAPAAPNPAQNAAPAAKTEASSVASLQAPARLARAPREQNAGPEASAADVGKAVESPSATAQLAAAPTAPPPEIAARQSAAPRAVAPEPGGAAAASPLIAAAEAGNLERVDQLLRHGISTDQTDAHGRTALLIATLRADVPMVTRLLAAGARADVADEDGDTPLAAARRHGPPELTRLLEHPTHP